MNKKTLIGIVVVIVLALVWWMLAKEPSAPTADATLNQIEGELNGLNQADLNAEFQSVDTDLNQL